MYSGESVRPTWSGIAIVHGWSSLSVCCPAGTAPATACWPLAGGCAAFDLPDVTGRRRVALVVVLGAISPSSLMAKDAFLRTADGCRIDCSRVTSDELLRGTECGRLGDEIDLVGQSKLGEKLLRRVLGAGVEAGAGDAKKAKHREPGP